MNLQRQLKKIYQTIYHIVNNFLFYKIIMCLKFISYNFNSLKLEVLMENNDIVAQLTNLVIRPHRQIYGLDRLGSKKMLVKSKLTKHFIHAQRKDCTLSQNRRIQMSIFEPEVQSQETLKQQSFQSLQAKQLSNEFFSNITKSNSNSSQIRKNSQNLKQKKFGIFLHSNSGSRLQGIEYAKYLLQYGISVVVFDYCGSGISEGQYVTMGINESQDLHQVFKYLKQQYGVQKVALWGRSMGAVTAILYASNHPENIIALTLDSPFSSFHRLITDIAKSRTGLPNFLFYPIITRIQNQIKQKTGCNLFSIDLKRNMSNLKSIPCLFLTSKHDQLVPCAHTEQLFKLHQGAKDIIYLQGQHNEPRALSAKQRCAQFLYESFLQKIKQRQNEQCKAVLDKQRCKPKASIRKHIEKQNQKINFERKLDLNQKYLQNQIRNNKNEDLQSKGYNGGEQSNKQRMRISDHQEFQSDLHKLENIRDPVPKKNEIFQDTPIRNLFQKSGFTKTVENFIPTHFTGYKGSIAADSKNNINEHERTSIDIQINQQGSQPKYSKKNTKITLTNTNISQLKRTQFGLQNQQFINNIDAAHANTRNLKQDANKPGNQSVTTGMYVQSQGQQKLSAKSKSSKFSLSQFKKSTMFNSNIIKNHQELNGSNHISSSSQSSNNNNKKYDQSDHQSNPKSFQQFRMPFKSRGCDHSYIQNHTDQTPAFFKQNMQQNKKAVLSIPNVPIKTSIIYNREAQRVNDSKLIYFCSKGSNQLEDQQQFRLNGYNRSEKYDN